MKRACVNSTAKWALLLILSLGLCGCVLPGSNPNRLTKAQLTEMPADFRIDYREFTGALPPPYDHTYFIRAGASAPAEVVLEIESGQADVDDPQWVEPLTLRDSTLADLYRLMGEHGIFTHNWRQGEIPTGGGSERLTVTAHGKTFEVPSFLERRGDIDEVYAAVRNLVPPETWEKLEEQRAEYESDHAE